MTQVALDAKRDRSLTALVAVCVLPLAIAAGCDQGSRSAYQRPILSPGEMGQEIDHLSLALELLNGLGPYDSLTSHRQLLQHLDEWIDTQGIDPGWIADPMFLRLPERFDPVKSKDTLTRRRFDSFDVLTLQEAAWLNQTSQRVVSYETEEPSVGSWLEPMRPTLDDESMTDLTEAARLFDWTVRNIQIDAEPEDTSAKAGEETGGHRPNQTTSRYFVWESLLRGHGDPNVRCRIFILLARQRGIDVVMLALDNGPDEDPTPWLPAAFVGGQLYLFDMNLGLPVPGVDGQGIATLAQVRAEPKLLRQLDLSKEQRYGVRASMLKRTVALIDATPSELSQRMRMLQNALPPERAIVLAVSPASIARDLRGGDSGIRQAKLWTAPYSVMEYKSTEFSRLQSKQMTVDQFLADEESIFKIHPRTILRQSSVAGAVLQLVQQIEQWSGTAPELLDELGLRVRDEDKRQANWPTSGPSLAQQLRLLQPSLKAGGCEVESQERELRRVWSLRRTADSGSPSAVDVERIKQQPLARYLLKVAEQQGQWSGTAPELLDQIELRATDQERQQASWPLNGPALAEQLRTVQSTLSAAGWQLEAKTESPRGIWTLRRIKLETPLLEGRLNHLRARINNDPLSGRTGAKGYYLECLIPNREIEKHGREESTETPTNGQNAASATDATASASRHGEMQLIYRIKLTASYWLGLIALDNADYAVAANYVGKRTLDAAPDGMWVPGARYNLARAHEAMGRLADDPEQLEKARTYYLADEDSPQRYGNQLRARRLKSLVEAATQ